MLMTWVTTVTLVLAYQVNQALCSCPDLNSPSSIQVKDLCKNSMCNQAADGHICHCDIKFSTTASHEKFVQVDATIVRDLCWEKQANYGDEMFYEDCKKRLADDKKNNRDEGRCSVRETIKICYSNDVDAAQAICRKFDKGDAREVMKSSSRKWLEPWKDENERTRIAFLRCPQYAANLQECTLEFRPEGSKCKQMIAYCFDAGCWQKEYVIRNTNSKTGIVSYGQACKQGNNKVCENQCFRCPPGSKFSSRDGTRCFKEQGHTNYMDLYWDPHFRTLDGKHFDFQGQCSYYLLKNGHFSIIAKFEVCGKKGVTCAKEITITTGRTEIRLGQGDDFTIKYRGRTMRRARKPFHNNDINYYLASSEFDAVDVWNGVKILWDREAEYRAVIPDWNFNMQTRGLIGNRNDNPNDDMIKPNEQLTTDPVEFGNSWLVPGSCPPGVSPRAPPNPVLTQTEKNEAHSRGCKYMNPFGINPYYVPDPFKACNSANATKEKKAEYENCLMDVATCSDSRDLSDCLCPSFEFLADYCERIDKSVGNWRSKMPNSLCQRTCDESKGEVFRMNANPCNQTCDAIKYVRDKTFRCIKMKVEGCNCDDGYARDAQGKCILISQCPN